MIIKGLLTVLAVGLSLGGAALEYADEASKWAEDKLNLAVNAVQTLRGLTTLTISPK